VNSLGISPSVVPCASGAPPGHRTSASPAGGAVIVAAGCAVGVAGVSAASGRVTRRMEAATSSRLMLESISWHPNSCETPRKLAWVNSKQRAELARFDGALHERNIDSFRSMDLQHIKTAVLAVARNAPSSYSAFRRNRVGRHSFVARLQNPAHTCPSVS
jgi:hypothetical protein